MAKWFANTSDPVGEYAVRRLQTDRSIEVKDQLAEEVPVALVYNGVSHTVMLASPQDLEDFALGFSLTEGLLKNKTELYGVDVKMQENGIELHLDVATERFMQLKERRKSMAGRTGCGLCGAESLAQVFHLPEDNVQAEVDRVTEMVSIRSVFKAQHDIKALQTLQQATGATHACAWADQAGDIHFVREDVGRHNALDKLIGALNKANVRGGFILTTSRASYEMVQKVTMAGFDMLAAISAPTGLAVRIAEAYGITLLGFVREQQFVAYSHANKIIE
jgi:FdhD protein